MVVNKMLLLEYIYTHTHTCMCVCVGPGGWGGVEVGWARGRVVCGGKTERATNEIKIALMAIKTKVVRTKLDNQKLKGCKYCGLLGLFILKGKVLFRSF